MPATVEPALAPLRRFVDAMTRLVGSTDDEAEIVDRGSLLMTALIADDAWLPDYCAVPDPVHYRQYLLHCDPLERFSVASFVWGPGQRTPIHDHTVWGLVGVLRGAEIERRFDTDAEGRLVAGRTERLPVGGVSRISARDGDLHEVANGCEDQVSISIHAYGGNIGRVRRNVYDPVDGAKKQFISGYSNAVVPNIWAFDLGGVGA